MSVVGGIIGTGIFLNPAIVAQRLPSGEWVLLAWAAGGVIAMLGAIIFAELGQRMPRVGGGYAYLREAFHFVRLTSGFTPLAARRMDPALLELRQWILHHSADEMGHELMARDDLADLGDPPEVTEASRPAPGTLAWVHFFHYQVCVRPPFAALGVLYFLEGMAAGLAMVVSTTILYATSERPSMPAGASSPSRRRMVGEASTVRTASTENGWLSANGTRM